LREQVRDKYRDVAADPHATFHFHTGRPLAARLGYDDAMLSRLPDQAVESFAGVGNPFSLRHLERGERVVVDRERQPRPPIRREGQVVHRADGDAADLHLIAGDELARVVERHVDAVRAPRAQKQHRDEHDRQRDRAQGQQTSDDQQSPTDRQATPPVSRSVRAGR